MATVLTATSAHDLYQQAVGLVQSGGRLVPADRSESNLGDYAYLEVSDVTIELTTPRARLVGVDDFPLARALLRALWLIAGADDVRPLTWLFPDVGRFSDDGDHLAGSAVGARLRHEQDGAAQLAGVIARLQRHPNTRRASVTSWLPQDSIRVSKDIPCLLSLTWRIRDGRLHCTSVMRANNLIRLLPYNLFEYTFLTECIAATLGLDVGPHVHHVISLHVYEPDLERLATIGSSLTASTAPREMLPIPASDSVIADATNCYQTISSLLQFPLAVVDAHTIDDLAAARRLNPYWLQQVREVVHAAREFNSASQTAGAAPR